MRSTDHLEAARRQDELASHADRWPQTTSMTPGGTDVPVPIPWSRRWDTAADHDRLAKIHRSEAEAQQAAFAEACGTRDMNGIMVSPLQRFAIGGANTPGGAVVYLDRQAGGADALLADLRCHRAWMMLGPSGMDDCPLDVPGLLVDAKGDASGVTLTLSVKDPKLVPELQRRVAVDLEAHHRHSAH